jgi:peroxiredoxin family protein
LGILLISAEPVRAHYAFVLATGAAAIGRGVVLFATDGGCAALLHDLAGFAAFDAQAKAREVATLSELRDAAMELRVRMIACEAGLRLSGVTGDLADGVEIAGVVTFLEAATGQVITL